MLGQCSDANRLSTRVVSRNLQWQTHGTLRTGAMMRAVKIKDVLLPKWRNGRREGLKNLWALARVGSTPTFGTKRGMDVENAVALAGLM